MYRKERKSMTQSKSATYRQILLKLAAIITAGILLSSCSHIPVYAKTDPGWNGQGGVAQEQTEGGEYQIFVGSSSKDLLLDGVITKEGTVSVGPYDVEENGDAYVVLRDDGSCNIHLDKAAFKDYNNDTIEMGAGFSRLRWSN